MLLKQKTFLQHETWLNHGKREQSVDNKSITIMSQYEANMFECEPNIIINTENRDINDIWI